MPLQDNRVSSWMLFWRQSCFCRIVALVPQMLVCTLMHENIEVRQTLAVDLTSLLVGAAASSPCLLLVLSCPPAVQTTDREHNNAPSKAGHDNGAAPLPLQGHSRIRKHQPINDIEGMTQPGQRDGIGKTRNDHDDVIRTRGGRNNIRRLSRHAV